MEPRPIDTQTAGVAQASARGTRELCPDCGSDTLTVSSDKRRAPAAGTRLENGESWPGQERDAIVDRAPERVGFAGAACSQSDMTPVREGVRMSYLPLDPCGVAPAPREGPMGDIGSPAWEELAAVLNRFGVQETLVTLGSLIKFSAIQWYPSFDQVPELERDIITLAQAYMPVAPAQDEESQLPF